MAPTGRGPRGRRARAFDLACDRTNAVRACPVGPGDGLRGRLQRRSMGPTDAVHPADVAHVRAPRRRGAAAGPLGRARAGGSVGARRMDGGLGRLGRLAGRGTGRGRPPSDVCGDPHSAVRRRGRPIRGRPTRTARRRTRGGVRHRADRPLHRRLDAARRTGRLPRRTAQRTDRLPQCDGPAVLPGLLAAADRRGDARARAAAARAELWPGGVDAGAGLPHPVPRRPARAWLRRGRGAGARSRSRAASVAGAIRRRPAGGRSAMAAAPLPRVRRRQWGRARGRHRGRGLGARRVDGTEHGGGLSGRRLRCRPATREFRDEPRGASGRSGWRDRRADRGDRRRLGGRSRQSGG